MNEFRPHFLVSAVLVLVGYLALALGNAGVSAQNLSPDQQKELIELASKAQEKYKKKDYAGAIDSYQEYLGKLPRQVGTVDMGRAFTHYNLTANYLALKQEAEAYTHLENAISYGLWGSSFLERDPTLMPLRARQDFKNLIDRAKNGPARAPFGFKDLDGKLIKEADYKGKVMIIDLWGTWCPPCKYEIPHFVELQEKYKKQGLRIIGMTYQKQPPSETVRQSVKRFADVMGINYPCTLATEDVVQAIGQFAGQSSFPTTIFVDRDGVVRKTLLGYHNLPGLEREILPLLKEKAKPAKSEAN